MNITAYIVNDTSDKLLTIAPAGKTRNWMDASSGKYAYNCLPLVIANQLGWVVSAAPSFSVIWDGRDQKDALKFSFDACEVEMSQFVVSHFGQGIVSFKLPWVFRTNPGIGLIVRGPSNQWLHGAHGLEGFVETWGLESTFTMNWKITIPNINIHFPAHFPFCQIMPYDIATINNYTCSKKPISANKPLQEKYTKWLNRRKDTLKNLFSGTKTTNYYEKNYFKGLDVEGEKIEGHLKKLNLSQFD